MSTAPLEDRRTSSKEAAATVGGLFARHGRMVYGICRAMLRDVHEAEDATQQVFLSAHKALLGGADVRDSGGWLATIARNECRARIGAGMRRPLAVADEDLHAIPSTSDDQQRQADRDEIRAALADLPERQREAVVLRYFYGLRYGEVAAALGLSRPATEALLFRARRALRTSLRPVVGLALAVPVAVRDQLALALPGFEERAAPVALGVGVAGGVLAKLAAGSTGVQVATATVAVATVGAVGSAGPHRPVVPRAEAAVERSVSDDRSDSSSSGSRREDEPGGHAGAADDSERDDDDRAGSGRDDDRDDRARDGDGRDDSGSGSDGDEEDAGPNDDATETGLSSGQSGSGSSGSGSSGSGKGEAGHSGSGSSGSGGGDDLETTEPDDPNGAADDSSEPGSSDDEVEVGGED